MNNLPKVVIQSPTANPLYCLATTNLPDAVRGRRGFSSRSRSRDLVEGTSVSRPRTLLGRAKGKVGKKKWVDEDHVSAMQRFR